MNLDNRAATRLQVPSPNIAVSSSSEIEVAQVLESAFRRAQFFECLPAARCACDRFGTIND